VKLHSELASPNEPSFQAAFESRGELCPRSLEIDAALLQLADVIEDLDELLKKHASTWYMQSQEERMRSALQVLRQL